MTHYQTPIVLCDANFSCIPLALNLLERGHRFAVCGNLPRDPCHRYAQASLCIDYSDQLALLREVESAGAQFLVAGCNDRSYLSCAYVAEQLGLPGYDPYETVLVLHEKDRFRAFATAQGYPIPQFFEHPDEPSSIEFPVLVKPVDAFSGRGISKVVNATGLEPALRAARAASRSANAVVEAFVEGALHSHSAFIRGGRIVLDFFVDEFCTVYEYQVNSSCLSTTLSEGVQRSVRDCITQIVAELGLCDGLLHTQFLATGERFWLIELTRRCPGDLYSQLIRYSTGVDYAAFYVNGFLGEPVPEGVALAPSRHVARHTASTCQPGHLFGLRHRIPSSDVQVLQLKTCGEYLNPAPFDKAAILFAEFGNKQELSRITPLLKDFISFDMLPSFGESNAAIDFSPLQPSSRP